jgi:hypothetical protein
MAKAVVPMRAFREKYGDLSGDDLGARLAALMQDFLTHEPLREVKNQKLEVKSESEELKAR